MKGKMGPAMKEYGGHAAAMKELGVQYKAYKAGFQGAEPVVAAVSEKSAALAEDMLTKNRALQEQILQIGGPPASPRLAAIDERIASLSGPAPKKPLVNEIAEQAAGGVGAGLGYHVAGPIGGMVGYKLASRGAQMVLEGGLGKKLAGGVDKSRAAIARGASAFATGAEKVGQAAPQLATKILASTSFAPEGTKSTRPLAKSANPLVNAYKARESELRSQTTMGPDGKPTVSPQARSDLHQRLHALWMVDPKLADMVETAATMRLAFLASKLPQRPSSQTMKFGPDKWHPGEMDMRKWARYVDAADNPDAIFDRLASGKMNPEDAEVLREVYPATMQAAKMQILDHLTALQETLPYRKRLMLSMFFDVPVEQSLEPGTYAVLQATFTSEPGTNGGMEPPALNKGGLEHNTPPPPTAAQRISAP